MADTADIETLRAALAKARLEVEQLEQALATCEALAGVPPTPAPPAPRSPARRSWAEVVWTAEQRRRHYRVRVARALLNEPLGFTWLALTVGIPVRELAKVLREAPGWFEKVGPKVAEGGWDRRPWAVTALGREQAAAASDVTDDPPPPLSPKLAPPPRVTNRLRVVRVLLVREMQWWEIAHHSGVGSNSLKTVLEGLTRDGVVVKTPGPHLGRSKGQVYSLSDEGRRQLEASGVDWAEVDAAIGKPPPSPEPVVPANATRRLKIAMLLAERPMRWVELRRAMSAPASAMSQPLQLMLRDGTVVKRDDGVRVGAMDGSAYELTGLGRQQLAETLAGKRTPLADRRTPAPHGAAG